MLRTVASSPGCAAEIEALLNSSIAAKATALAVVTSDFVCETGATWVVIGTRSGQNDNVECNMAKTKTI